MIEEKLEAVMNKNDVEFTLKIEYGEQGWSFTPQGLLFEITTKISILKYAYENNQSIPIPISQEKINNSQENINNSQENNNNSQANNNISQRNKSNSQENRNNSLENRNRNKNSIDSNGNIVVKNKNNGLRKRNTKKLVEMGFGEDESVAALITNDDNIERSIAMLTSDN